LAGRVNFLTMNLEKPRLSDLIDRVRNRGALSVGEMIAEIQAGYGCGRDMAITVLMCGIEANIIKTVGSDLLQIVDNHDTTSSGNAKLPDQ